MDVHSRSGRAPITLVRIAAFAAIGVVGGWALSAIPNIELVTAVCFSAGFLLGPVAGMLTGVLTETLFAGFHPMGSTFGPVLLAQVLGMAIAGWLGAVTALVIRRNRSGWFYTAVVACASIVTTAVFDLLTNLAFPLSAGFSHAQFLASMLAAVPFAGIHIVSNFFVFLLVVAPLLPRLEKVMKVT
jgi:energy-coupling factor transport system substrate-specific component